MGCFGGVPDFLCGGGILCYFSTFGSRKAASGVDDDQGVNALDSKLLFEGSNAGMIVIWDCEPAHFNKVSLEGFCVAVKRDENHFEDFALRVYFKTLFSKFRDENVTGRGPSGLQSRD